MYQVNLPIFEGPLDLLLHLIREKELNIYDISVAKITSSYLEYLVLMRELNLEISTEFLSMASYLLKMKSRELLPRPEIEEEEGDLKEGLTRQLLEYKKYKEAACSLEEKKFQEEEIFKPGQRESFEQKEEIKADLPALLAAFGEILKRIDKKKKIYQERWTVRQKIEEILDKFSNINKLAFANLFLTTSSRMELIVTFLALLELVRLGKLSIRQRRMFSEIWIYKKI
ncbi:segregation/condensation protein A [bacterium]|nr:segregation/condensation protein A [bacterium]MBU1614478.1 segregation/condensation protein A [bacterium]